MLQVGSILEGKYKILEKISQGGMSVVYLAVNERVNKKWAIKEIRRDGNVSVPIAKKSLLSELYLLRNYSHPSLPALVDVIEWDDFFLLVMEYVEGKTLSQILDQYGAQPQNQVLRWAIQLCEVLGYLHSRMPPITYGDLKPENVMIRPNGKVVLIDFGTVDSRDTRKRRGAVPIGTIGYVAPERYNTRSYPDAREDIYGLGATMYHLLTGIHPGTLHGKQIFFDGEKEKVSWKLKEVILICTQKRPEDRYSSCSELKSALNKCFTRTKVQKNKDRRLWKRFLIFSIFSASGFLGAAGFYLAECETRNRAYRQYLEDATSFPKEEQKCRMYEKAILLKPTEGEAYLKLLQECFLSDHLLTVEEDERLRNILGVASGMPTSNENKLKRNRKDYEAFAYQAAMAYYYYFEDGIDNKSCAIKWLNVVRNASTLRPSQIKRGKRLGTIAEYYSSIGIVRPDENETVTYLDYWKDMRELISENLFETESIQTAVTMYGEWIGQMYRHCDQFAKAGITKKDMDQQIQQVEKYLWEATDTVKETRIDSLLTDRILQIREQIKMLRSIMETVYEERKKEAKEPYAEGGRNP